MWGLRKCCVLYKGLHYYFFYSVSRLKYSGTQQYREPNSLFAQDYKYEYIIKLSTIKYSVVQNVKCIIFPFVLNSIGSL
jgi:hypothetical protein